MTREYAELKEVAIFLAQPNVLPPGQALGLYISVSGEWQVGQLACIIIDMDHPSMRGGTHMPAVVSDVIGNHAVERLCQQ